MIPATEFAIIGRVLDKYFSLMDRIGSCRTIAASVPAEMLDRNKTVDKDYSYWLPIASTTSMEEIRELESYVGHRLPESYRYFLQQRHFIDLSLGGHCIGFFKHVPVRLKTDFQGKVEAEYPNLLDRNYIPFAQLMDFGVVCFDATDSLANYDYPVVVFSHEDGCEDAEFYAKSFLNMFMEFEDNLDQWIQNVDAKL